MNPRFPIATIVSPKLQLLRGRKTSRRIFKSWFSWSIEKVSLYSDILLLLEMFISIYTHVPLIYCHLKEAKVDKPKCLYETYVETQEWRSSYTIMLSAPVNINRMTRWLTALRRHSLSRLNFYFTFKYICEQIYWIFDAKWTIRFPLSPRFVIMALNNNTIFDSTHSSSTDGTKKSNKDGRADAKKSKWERTKTKWSKTIK